MIGKCDDKGRIYIPKKFRSKIHNEVYIVELPEGLLIVPIPDDPLAVLESIGKNLPEKSIPEFREIIKEDAVKEISESKKSNPN